MDLNAFFSSSSAPLFFCSRFLALCPHGRRRELFMTHLASPPGGQRSRHDAATARKLFTADAADADEEEPAAGEAA